MTVLGYAPYAPLFLVVMALAFGAVHRWLEFVAGLRRPIAVALALIAGAAAGGFALWLTLPNPATISECVDFTPDPSGRC